MDVLLALCLVPSASWKGTGAALPGPEGDGLFSIPRDLDQGL